MRGLGLHRQGGAYTFVTAGELPQNTRLSPRFTWMASKETDSFTRGRKP